MLSAAQLRGTQQRRRSPYSDKQYYQEYILQRIEGYKNSIGRDELLRLGDEAASELQTAAEGQFLLTEVLMLESVDRLIMKRLSLRPYSRWRREFIADLQRRSRPGSVHIVLPCCPTLAPETLLAFYKGWMVEEDGRRRRRSGGGRRADGLILSAPSCPPDTAAKRSTAS